jgi:hypothetical protein
MNQADWKFLLQHCSDSLTMAYRMTTGADATATALLVLGDIEKIGEGQPTPKLFLAKACGRVVEILAAAD